MLSGVRPTRKAWNEASTLTFLVGPLIAPRHTLSRTIQELSLLIAMSVSLRLVCVPRRFRLNVAVRCRRLYRLLTMVVDDIFYGAIVPSTYSG